jgi:hypothetical protein
MRLRWDGYEDAGACPASGEEAGCYPREREVMRLRWDGYEEACDGERLKRSEPEIISS